jgi:C-terminal processing protease CtpA/Prc
MRRAIRMNRRFRTFATLLLSVFLLSGSAAGGPDKGWFGFSVTVDGDGFFLNPVLRSVTITSVTPGSPAAARGLTAGDQVAEVEGVVVVGSKADDVQPLMQKAVGQPLHLRLRRPTGELYSATLIAAEKPK